MTFFKPAHGPFSRWKVGEYVIRNALSSRGYTRRIVRAKAPLSENNIKIRRKWVEDHLAWQPQQWGPILWSDETWITGGRHTKTWITRRPGEEL